MAATAIYRAFMLELERRRIELGITMLDLDEVAGTHTGYYGKCQAVDSPSGRQTSWAMLELFVQSLFPNGVDIVLKAREGGQLDASSYRQKIQFAAATAGRRGVRALMRELGIKGGAARMATLTPEQRSELAKKAGQAGGRGRRRDRRVLDAEGSVIGPPEDEPTKP